MCIRDRSRPGWTAEQQTNFIQTCIDEGIKKYKLEDVKKYKLTPLDASLGDNATGQRYKFIPLSMDEQQAIAEKIHAAKMKDDDFLKMHDEDWHKVSVDATPESL